MGAYIQAFLALCKLIPQVLAAIERLNAYVKKEKLDKWLDDLHVTIDDLEKAQTSEEKTNAARRLVALTRRL